MTLIFEIRDANNSEAVLISDCMAFPSDYGELRPNWAPLHHGSGWTIDTKGISLVSKFWIERDRIILSAGNVERIESAVQHFSSASSLEAFCNSLEIYYENKQWEESYIFKMRQGDGFLGTDANCRSFSSGHLDFFVGGSGEQYLEQLISSQSPDPSVSLVHLATELLAQIMRKEFVDYDFKTHTFGGAYEVCAFGSNGPERVPYSIIDSVCNANLATDGVYDLSNREFSRFLLCCPVEGGTCFFVLSQVGGEWKVTYFLAQQIGTEPRPAPTQEELNKILISHRAAFTISIIRHSDVNFSALGGNMFEVRNLDSDKIELNLDTDKLEERERFFLSSAPR